MLRRISFVTCLSLGFIACSQSASTPGAPGGALPLPAPSPGPGAPSGLAYQIGRPTYRIGRAIAANAAIVSGANVTFAAQPALPAGLVLDSTTGAITGTPSGSLTTTTHTVTASNANGSTTTGLRITIVPFGAPLDPAQFGQAGSVNLVSAAWGRLVDVYDRDNGTGSTHLILRDVLVRDDLPAAPIYAIETNVATQGTRITIFAPLGTPAFANAFDQLEANLPTIAAAGPGQLPPFSVVPRNAAMALIFDDLIDPATLSSETLRVLTGVPAVAVQSARLRTDANHGNVADRNGDGQFEFWSTRVLIDPVVTEMEALADAQMIQPDPDGYPPSQSSAETNLLLRIPTVVDAGSGQFTLLRNLTGAPVSNTQSGPIDVTVPTLDVVRALRSGGPTAATGDAFEGFLYDVIAPRIVAEVPVAVGGVQADPLGNPEDKLVDVTFGSPGCMTRLEPGYALQVGQSVMEVLATSGSGIGLTIPAVRVKIIARTGPLSGAGTLLMRLDLALNGSLPSCFLGFDPPAGSAPAAFVDPSARVILRADEPLDTRSLSALDATRITRDASNAARAIVPASIDVPADLRGVALRPLVPLAHQVGVAETYLTWIDGWTDLAGNPMADSLDGVPFTIDSAAQSVVSGGVTFRFDSNDMLPGAGAPPDAGSGKPEFRGQFLVDLGAGIAQGRPVSRFQLAADRTQPVPNLMVPFAPGVQTPISRYGSKMQGIWRYCDVGLALLDEQFHNIDVEHMYWSPAGGAAFSDAVTRFEISLTHAAPLPDETLDANLQPFWPFSGLVSTYAQNVADPVNDPLHTVHPGANGAPGYVVQPSDASMTAGGTPIMPWPLNQGLPLDEYERYTWRDTGLQSTGGAGGPGAELQIVGTSPYGQPYAAGSVPTIGLPLLMEYRCYPDANTLGLNAFDISIAVGSSPRPNFRAFSTGGISTGGMPILRDPDLQTVATGGFNPGSIPTPGATTSPLDNVFAIGALDLVVRVSRMHSIWIDTGAATAEWASAMEPQPADQPAGTEVQLAFRGATSVANVGLTTDATTLDPYGNALAGAQPTFFQADATWKVDASSLNGSRLLQTRVTFVANAATNATSDLSALGIAWR